jgi:hypothetical protein
VNVELVMDEMADRLRTITGLRVHEWPLGTATPPAAIVAYPSECQYDQTYGNGIEALTISVVVLVGRPSDRSTRTELSAYMRATGASSVKSALESGTPVAFDTIVVTGVVSDIYELAAVSYLAAIFTCELFGPGG